MAETTQPLPLRDALDALDTGDGLASASDVNLLRLRQVLAEGALVDGASYLPDGVPPWAGPCLLLAMREKVRSEATTLVVGLGERCRRVLAESVPDVLVHGLPADAAGPALRVAELSPDHRAELKRRIDDSARLDPDERPVALCDWLLDQLGASRCAIVPFVSGSADLPIVFQHRRQPDKQGAPTRVPRAVLTWVAAQRASLVSHHVGAGGDVLAADGTLTAQRVRSYMAVPVIFRSDLLAVAYVDHLDRPRRFSPADQALFEAFAYELATPLLTSLEERRRAEYLSLVDDLLSDAGDEAETTGRALAPVIDQARRLAGQSTENLLILGETGTGKEWLARKIHAWSGRGGAFVPVNVSALSPELFESELMGSTRGAFTGAVDRIGRVEEAAGGTLFLDEIGDLAPENQVKLLRFLQDRAYRRLGEGRQRTSDARVVAATNQDVQGLVENGDLRADLVHRFAPPLVIPPLRERRDEILPHARAWLRAKAKQAGKESLLLDASAESMLIEHSWPGNIRQLRTVLSHAVALADGTVDRATLEELFPERSGPRTTAGSLPQSWPEYRSWCAENERRWLRAVLAAGDGKPDVAARGVDCPPSTLRSLLKKHGLLG